LERTLHIGPVALVWRLDGADRRWEPFLAAYAAYFQADGPPPRARLTIEAEVGPATADGAARLPVSMARARQVSGRDFDVAHGLIVGTVPAPDLCRCRLDPVLLAGCGLRVLEQFFYLLFYQAALREGEPAPDAPFLLHGSAARTGRGVHVFCGPSGAGKSTAAGHSRAHPILTDEAIVVTPAPDPPDVRIDGSPINPFNVDKEPGGGPLAGLYLLAKAPVHALRPVAREEALPRLTQEVMVPLGLLETSMATGMARALERAHRLWASGRVQELQFRPDPGFWALLEA
jgi:hypothetical protein